MIYIRKQVRFEGQQQQRKQPSLSGVVGALFRACVVCTRTVRLHRIRVGLQTKYNNNSDNNPAVIAPRI